MSVTVELPEDALARLRAEAARRGVSIDTLIAEFAAQLPSDPPVETKRKPGFMGIGVSRSRRGARDSDEILADGFGRD